MKDKNKEVQMIVNELKRRGVPAIEDYSPEEWENVRQKYVDILCREEYGIPVPAPDEVWFEELPLSFADKRFCAGDAPKQRVVAHTKICGREFSFPFWAIIPKAEGKYPFIIHNDFEDLLPSKYTPAEEIINNGFALFSLCYKDITSDDGDFRNGLAGIVTQCPDHRAPTDAGKIQMWAWANMRVMDYAATKTDKLDLSRAAVAGHSRLGKTALVTGMLDTRIKYVIDNESGCGGSALVRGTKGEKIADITKNFPYWFCENYKKYAGVEPPFDQHFLLASIAPRYVLVGSADEDYWACPPSQFLCCAAASKAWENLGLDGLVAPDREIVIGDNFDGGHVCYHVRSGDHYFSRRDWNVYMEIMKK